jgi:hypothetical protein
MAPSFIRLHMQTLADITRATMALDPGLDAPGRDAAFDAWLKRELARLFDTVRREELPAEMLRLLGE